MTDLQPNPHVQTTDNANDVKAVLVEDEPTAGKTTDLTKAESPPWADKTVMLRDGRTIKRHQCAFGLHESKDNPGVFWDARGVPYLKMPDGSLRRMKYKKGEKRTHTTPTTDERTA